MYYGHSNAKQEARRIDWKNDTLSSPRRIRAMCSSGGRDNGATVPFIHTCTQCKGLSESPVGIVSVRPKSASQLDSRSVFCRLTLLGNWKLTGGLV
jgi:hypothetical protein